MKQINHRNRVIILCVIATIVWILSIAFSTTVQLQQTSQGEGLLIYPDWYEWVALLVVSFVYIPLSILLQYHSKLANIKPILYISRAVLVVSILALILGVISLFGT